MIESILKKLFKLREEAHVKHHRKKKGADEGYDAEEKPFLDHLEDLRVMLFKMAAVTVISMVICLVFNKQLLDAMRLPMYWANVGNPNILSIVVDETRNTDKPRYEPGKWIYTESGLIAKMVEDNPKLGISRVELAEGMVVMMRSNKIAGAMKTTEAGAPALSGVSDFERHQLLVMETFSPFEALMLVLKIAFFAGIVLAFPFLIYFAAQFILPGLREAEKKVVFPAMAVGFALFLIGAAFAFRVGLPLSLRYLYEFTVSHGIEPGWRIGYYVKFVTQVTLLFGVCFELPVAVMALVYAEVLTFKTMRDSRSYAIVIILVVAAIFTPPDPLTLLILGIPMIMLYEMCIWLAFFLEKSRAKREAEERRIEEEERARRREELARLPPADEMSEEEKRAAVNADIQRYESGATHADYNQHGHYDDHGHYLGEHDPHHGEAWDHQHHGDMGYGLGGTIDINHATLEQLQQLPGVGPNLAQRILDSRPHYSESDLEYHANLPRSVIRMILDRIYFG